MCGTEDTRSADNEESRKEERIGCETERTGWKNRKK
jgi:hypothetical protein